MGRVMYNYVAYPENEVEFIAVASADEVPSGERLFLEIDGKAIVVFNLAGEYFAIADLCSHDDGPLGEGEVLDHEVECPRHGARFDLRTGKALTLPAVVDIPAYPVRVEGGELLVGIPKEAV